MKIIFLFLSVSLSTLTFGQIKSDYSFVDRKVSEIPTKETVSVYSIANYISSNFRSQEDKIRAVFYWIADNIAYDVGRRFISSNKIATEEKLNAILKTRKGICSDYTELFKAITDDLEIETIIISGYTKQFGLVDSLSHSWCASKINGKWFLFDPTWAAGNVQSGRFFKKINLLYFKTNPNELINSHMPFDPLWQFLNYPVTHEEFYGGIFKPAVSKQYYNFETEISHYLSLSDSDKIIASTKRIESMGIINDMISDQLVYNRKKIEMNKRSEILEEYDNLLDLFHEGVNELNSFIRYRNKQFKPMRSDKEIKDMIHLPYLKLIKCQDKINNLGSEKERFISNLSSTKKSLQSAIEMAKEHDAFVSNYLSKETNARETMFYKQVVK